MLLQLSIAEHYVVWGRRTGFGAVRLGDFTKLVCRHHPRLAAAGGVCGSLLCWGPLLSLDLIADDRGAGNFNGCVCPFFLFFPNASRTRGISVVQAQIFLCGKLSPADRADHHSCHKITSLSLVQDHRFRKVKLTPHIETQYISENQ